MYSCDDTLAGGLPHSDIHGSTPARGSPWLFAACHVLHRLLVPRHPPNALLSLETLAPGPKPGNLPCTETILRSRRPISPSVNPENQPSTKRTEAAQSRNHSCSAHNSSPLNTAPSLDAETSGQTSRWSRPETHQNLIHIYKEPCPQFGDTSGVAASHRNHQHRLLSLLRDTHPNNSNTEVVEVIGLEPTTPCLQSRCSPS